MGTQLDSARPDGAGMANSSSPVSRVSSLSLLAAACVACSGPEPPDGAPADDLVPPGSIGVAGAVGLGSRAATGLPTGMTPAVSSGEGGAGGERPDGAGFGGAGGEGSEGAPPNLLLSEYIEGSSSNKALELVNRGARSLELAACAVELYTNGAATLTRRIALDAETLVPGGVWVLCHPSSHASILTVCDQASGSMNYNGNDALVVVCDGAVQDSFGQVGVDPGASWAGATTRTADATLRRRCSVSSGDTMPGDLFDPDTEWSGQGADVFDYLGDPACAPDETGAGGTGGSSGQTGGAAGHPADCN